MTAHDDVRDLGDRLEWTEDRDLELHVGSVSGGQRREAGILGGCRRRAPRHDLDERFVALRATDAAAQGVAMPEGHKRPGMPRQRAFTRRYCIGLTPPRVR